jgi:flagellar biosynthetic protein FlhB
MEGNPQMKARIRRLQRDRARRQMMKEVPTATAVVVNPTHFAVALRYQVDGMAAPMVVAKGKNYLAARIRQRAVEHQVPIVENPPLAQALYKSVEVGQEIPPHLYRAVAEILAYIFRLMNGRLPG